MSDKETAEGVTDEVMPDDDKSAEQIWFEISGQNEEPIASDVSSLDDNLEADADPEEEEPATEEASSDADDGDTGQPADEQRADEPDFEEKEKRYKGTISALTRKQQQQQREIAEFKDKLNEKRAEDDQIENLDQLREEYPELMDPLLKRMDKQDEQLNALMEQMSTVSDFHRTEFETHAVSQDQALEKLSPGWQQTIDADKHTFWDWVDDQPKADRQMVEASVQSVQDAEHMHEIMSRYQAHLNGTDAQQQDVSEPHEEEEEAPKPKRDVISSRKLAGAQTVPSRGSQSARTTPRPDETDAAAIWREATK